MEAEKAEHKQEKDQRTNLHIANRRSGGEEEKDESEYLKPKKELEDYITGIDQSSQVNIITSYNPDIIEEELVKYLKG